MNSMLITKVHQHNSLDHLTSQRPSSAQRRTPSVQGRSISRPQSAMARLPSVKQPATPMAEMTTLQKAIYGHSGPPMRGVTTYPHSRSQKLYEEEFEQLVAATLTHPFTSITSFNVGSVPHNLITGTAFAERRGAGFSSEYTRSYKSKSYVESFNTKANGLRLEEFIAIG